MISRFYRNHKDVAALFVLLVLLCLYALAEVKYGR